MSKKKASVPAKTQSGIPTENYLIIGAGYLGANTQVMGVLNAVAQKYNCQVIHAGPLTERKNYERARKSLGVMGEFFLNEMRLIKQIASGFDRVEFLLPHISCVGFFSETLKNLATIEEQEDRIEALADIIAQIYPVSGDDEEGEDREFYLDWAQQIIESFELPKNATISVQYYKLLSKYLGVSSVQPKSEVATRVAPSNRLLDEYKKYASNWVLPYPTPEVTPKPKLGLNNTYNYFYTGCITVAPELDSSNQYYKTDHLPAAVLVIVDKETGHFHPRQIDVEVSTRHGIFATDDGLAFFPNGDVVELSNDDKGTWSTDDHAPFTHPGVIAALQKTNELHQPAIFVNGGDAGEMLSVHRHDRKNKQRKNMEGQRIWKDIKNIRTLLDAQTTCSSIKRKVKLDANHEGWLDLYVNEHPELDGLLDWHSIHKTYFSDWDFIFSGAGDNQTFYFGDILCRHGHQEGLLEGARISDHHKYLCGHHHSYKKFKRAIQTGCGASLGAAYLNNSATAWQSQVTTLSKYKQIASAAPKIVLHYDDKQKSRFAYRGNVYEVDWVILPGFLHDKDSFNR